MNFVLRKPVGQMPAPEIIPPVKILCARSSKRSVQLLESESE